MVPADAQADLAVHLEAAAGREEAERGGPQRVRGRQRDAPVVDAGCVGGGGRAAEGEVPVEDVRVGGGRGVEVGGGVGLEF